MARKHAETASFSYRRLQEIRAALHHSRALADEVLHHSGNHVPEILSRKYA